jgi:hypothetical protein
MLSLKVFLVESAGKLETTKQERWDQQQEGQERETLLEQ